jgi:glycosyltransferase involved in cell wall biosynthesis
MNIDKEPTPVTVIVPTYRRPDLLRRCLAGLSVQDHPLKAAIVVTRAEDELTADMLADPLPLSLQVVVVNQPGVLAAMAAGLAATRTPFIAFTDDDAVPRPDWVERLLGPFDDPSVGAVGGRDAIGGDDNEYPPSAERVGLVSPWGRLVGNHHIGLGPARDVDVLKGVNCMYRRSAVAIPENLRGSGAQAHFEVAVGLRAKARGWRLVYDPSIVVDHYPGPRFDGDARLGTVGAAVFDAAYNLTLSVGSFSRGAAVRRTAYSLCVGDRSLPGIARAATLVGKPGRRGGLVRLGSALRGNAEASLSLARGKRVRFYGC